MQVKILTSTMTYIKSVKKGIPTYSLSANEFNGYSQNNENGKVVNRAKMGRMIFIAESNDRSKLNKYIKQCRLAGDIIEIQGDNIRYGI